MDQEAERERVSPHAHAAALRAAIATGVVAAITDAVAAYTAAHPAQPWQLDCRPGATRLAAEVDMVLDDVLGAAVVRAVDGRMVSFPSRIVLA
jgi:hypothetical protein